MRLSCSLSLSSSLLSLLSASDTAKFEQSVEYCVEPFLIVRFTVHYLGLGRCLYCNLWRGIN